MKRITHHRAVIAILCSALLAASCDGEISGTDSTLGYPQTITLVGDGDGVDMLEGTLYNGEGESPKGTWLNSDVYTSASFDDGLKLWSGGPRNTEGRPATWFDGPGDVYSTLDAVPDSPVPTLAEVGVTSGKIKQGNGFIVLASDMTTYFKGVVLEATADSVTLEYAPLP